MNDTTFPLSSNDLLDILSLSEYATAIYTSDDIIIQSANNAMLDFFGKGHGIVGLPLEQAVPELEGQPFIGILKDVWRTGVSYEATDTPAMLQINGQLSKFYFDFKYRAIKNADGGTRCILHTAANVTGRYQNQQRIAEMDQKVAKINSELSAANHRLTEANEVLEQSEDTLLKLNNNLTESESQLQFAIDAARLGTWDLDPVNRRFSGNDRLRRWFGLEQGNDIPLTKAMDVIADADRPKVLAAITQAMQYGSGGVYDMEYTINPATQKTRIVRAKGRALFNIDREVIRFSGTLQDITEERKAKEELTEMNQRLQLALDAGKLGSYDVELESGKMECNGQCKLNYGWPLHQPFDLADMLGLILPEHRKDVQRRLKNAVDNHTTYHTEYQVQWPDGSRHWINASGKPRYDDKGKAVRLVGVVYDITESKTNEQRKDDFITIASHELKTPVTSLKSSLQLLDRMKDAPSPKIFPKLIEQSNRSVDRITTLIDDLLNVSRMNEGQLHLRKTTFTIADMLNRSSNHVKISGKNDLILEGDKHLQIYADEHRIDQVVVNLVNNAVKYAPNSREIRLMVEKAGDMAKISVQDYGPGIAQDKLPHLFDRYYRADYSGIQYSGLGLGLFISSEIIRKHGGEIGAYSEPGKGSTFWFTLPL